MGNCGLRCPLPPRRKSGKTKQKLNPGCDLRTTKFPTNHWGQGRGDDDDVDGKEKGPTSRMTSRRTTRAWIMKTTARPRVPARTRTVAAAVITMVTTTAVTMKRHRKDCQGDHNKPQDGGRG